MSDSNERPGTGHFKGLPYHHMLLADVHRMDAYERAIRALVEPGMVVLDLGTGTGILAMLAAKRGAARVHAVESTPIAALAERLVRSNGLEHIVRVHRADIRELSPIEPVDLIVSDFMGRFLVDDQMLTAVAASRAWLGPSGRYCPHVVGLRVAPVGNVWLNALELFADPIYGLDFSPAYDVTLNATYASQLAPAAQLAEPQVFADYDPGRSEPAELCRQLSFVLTRAGRLQALAGWFVAELADGVRLSTEPGIQSHWGQTMFPLPPCDGQVGDELAIELLLERAEPQRWRWRGEVRRDGERLVTFDQVSDQPLDADSGGAS